LVTAFAGFYLAGGEMDWGRLGMTLVGVALAAGGTMALNQYMERDTDRLMKRTQFRPLPAGRIRPGIALTFGVSIALMGLGILALGVNRLSGEITALIVVSYLLVYTPLKRRTPLSSVVGGIPGALPPVVGWVAASGEFHPLAGVLFAVLFFWQLPHLLAISWLYRADYARAGMRVFPVVDPEGDSTAHLVLTGCLALAATFLISFIWIDHNLFHLLVGTGLTFLFLRYGWQFAVLRTHRSARKLLLASYLYLPAVLVSEMIMLGGLGL
ncbi:MAG: protoheme IX farnesyltransferase, partial [Calditrichaeota bacterium]